MSDLIVGIDLGTTNSAVAIVEDGQPEQLFSNPKHERTRAFLSKIIASGRTI